MFREYLKSLPWAKVTAVVYHAAMVTATLYVTTKRPDLAPIVGPGLQILGQLSTPPQG